jgi:ketosteroid isomerase-like protein
MTDNLAPARRLLDAWNQGDVATVLALVTPDVEFETPGGVDRGPEAARQWVTKQTQPHATMHIVLEELLEAGDQVVVLFRRQMRWRETGELGDETPGAALLTFRVGKLLRWQMFPDRNQALEAAGLNSAETAPPAASTD